jgi:hypothetical protein
LLPAKVSFANLQSAPTWTVNCFQSFPNLTYGVTTASHQCKIGVSGLKKPSGMLKKQNFLGIDINLAYFYSGRLD